MIIEAFVCLALTVYHEARHLPEAEQEAVAHVVLNRVRSDRFPSTVCEVVRQGGTKRYKCQFTWYCDGKVDTPYEKDAWRTAERIAERSFSMPDPTGGALFYHATWVAPKGWWLTLTKVHVDAGHIYYR